MFEKTIKSCKTTNLEFLKLLCLCLGLCLYEDICDEQEFISTSEENFTQRDVENKRLKEENGESRKENEKLRKENENENENEQLKK